MLVTFSDKSPDAPGMYFVKLPDRSPLYVRVGTSGIITHPHTALLLAATHEQLKRAQWSERITF